MVCSVIMLSVNEQRARGDQKGGLCVRLEGCCLAI